MLESVDFYYGNINHIYVHKSFFVYMVRHRLTSLALQAFFVDLHQVVKVVVIDEHFLALGVLDGNSLVDHLYKLAGRGTVISVKEDVAQG